MDDYRAEVESQLDQAKRLRAKLEADKTREKAELVKRLEYIDQAYANQLNSATQAVDAFESMLAALGPETRLRVAPRLITAPTIDMRQAVRDIFRESGGEPITLIGLTSAVKSRGVQTRSKDYMEAVRSAIYGLRESGEPIKNIANRTWIYESLKNEQAQAAT